VRAEHKERRCLLRKSSISTGASSAGNPRRESPPNVAFKKELDSEKKSPTALHRNRNS